MLIIFPIAAVASCRVNSGDTYTGCDGRLFDSGLLPTPRVVAVALREVQTEAPPCEE